MNLPNLSTKIEILLYIIFDAAHKKCIDVNSIPTFNVFTFFL